MDWISCMFHIAETEFDYIEQTLNEYDIGLYLIGFEVSDKGVEHFHVLFQGTSQIYTKFSKRLIEKYNLRGKPGEGKARQYGKVKNIESIEKMTAYTLKDGNIRSNMSEEQLEKYRSISYKKDEDKKLFMLLVDKLAEHMKCEDPIGYGWEDWKLTMRQKIISLILENTSPDYVFTRHLVEKVMLVYLRRASNSVNTIYSQLYLK